MKLQRQVVRRDTSSAGSAEKSVKVFGEFAQKPEQVSPLITSKKCLNCRKPVRVVGVVRKPFRQQHCVGAQ